MKITVTLMILLSIIVLVGCAEESDPGLKPEPAPTNPTQDTGPTEPDPEEPSMVEPELPEEDLFLEQARDLMRKEIQRSNEEREKNPDEHLEQRLDRVFKEVYGFGLLFVTDTLEGIHLEEHPEEDKFPREWNPLILEYLRLRFKHPEQREGGLLRLFRQSSRNGNISVIPPNTKPNLE